MPTVTAFLSSLPGSLVSDPDKSLKKYSTLQKFIDGVVAAGDHGSVSRDMVWQPCDVAVILGWAHLGNKRSVHLLLRDEIVRKQRAHGGRVVIADSNLFLYKDTTNPHYYLRFSLDHVFPGLGQYCDDRPNPARWQQIQQDLGVSLQPWRRQGDHVLLCLQRDGGWSMNNYRVQDWAFGTIQALRQHTKRAIVLRPHPGDRAAPGYIKHILDRCQQAGLGQVTVSTQRDLTADLANCWAMVNHNSSPAVAAVIEGIPTFVTDPEHSQAREVANHDLSMIESPLLFERQQWVERISQFHWSHRDLEQGICWRHMRQYL